MDEQPKARVYLMDHPSNLEFPWRWFCPGWKQPLSGCGTAGFYGGYGVTQHEAMTKAAAHVRHYHRSA